MNQEYKLCRLFYSYNEYIKKTERNYNYGRFFQVTL